MTRWTYALAAAAVLLGSAGAAHAQAPDALARPKYSLSFGTAGGGTLGVGVRVSPRTDVGVELSADRRTYGYTLRDDHSHSRTSSLSLGASLKHYVGTGGPLAPYAYAGVFGGRETRHQQGDPDQRTLRTDVGLELGLGADWFVTPRVSIGGRIGAGAGVTRERDRIAGIPDVVFRGWWASTATPAIQATLYL